MPSSYHKSIHKGKIEIINNQWLITSGSSYIKYQSGPSREWNSVTPWWWSSNNRLQWFGSWRSKKNCESTTCKRENIRAGKKWVDWAHTWSNCRSQKKSKKVRLREELDQYQHNTSPVQHVWYRDNFNSVDLHNRTIFNEVEEASMF